MDITKSWKNCDACNTLMKDAGNKYTPMKDAKSSEEAKRKGMLMKDAASAKMGGMDKSAWNKAESQVRVV